MNRKIRETYHYAPNGQAELRREEVIAANPAGNDALIELNRTFESAAQQDGPPGRDLRAQQNRSLAETLALHWRAAEATEVVETEPAISDDEAAFARSHQFTVFGLAQPEPTAEGRQWVVRHKSIPPPGDQRDNLRTRFEEHYLDEMLFQSAFLDREPDGTEGFTEWKTSWIIEHVLPEGSRIVNEAQLNETGESPIIFREGVFRFGSRWRAGGNRVVHERFLTVFHAGDLAELGDDEGAALLDALWEAERFDIVYTFDRGDDNRPPGDAPRGPGPFALDFHHTFSWNRSANPPAVPSGTSPFTVRVSLPKFDGALELEWNWRRFRLHDFRARLELEAQQQTTVRLQHGFQGNHPLAQIPLWHGPSACWDVCFWAGSIPILVSCAAELSFEATLDGAVTAAGSVTHTLHGRFENEVSYVRGQHALPGPHQPRFNWVSSPKTLQWRGTLKANATLDPALPLQFSAKLYGTVGPYVKLTAKAPLTLDLAVPPTPNNPVTLTAELDLEGGIALSPWFANLMHTAQNQPIAQKTLAQHQLYP